MASLRFALHRLNRPQLATAYALTTLNQATTAADLAGHLGLAEELLVELDQSIVDLHERGLVWFDGSKYRPLRHLTQAFESLTHEQIQHLHPYRPIAMPQTQPNDWQQQQLDLSAGQHAMLVLSSVADLLDRLPELELRLTTEGVVALRSADTAAKELALSATAFGFLVELAWQAGLLGPDRNNEVLALTVVGRFFLEQPAPWAWAVLVQTWWHSMRDAAAFADEPRAAILGSEHVVTRLPQLRNTLFMVLAQLPEGTAAQVPVATLQDTYPLVDPEALARWTQQLWQQANELGLIISGRLSTMAEALLQATPVLDSADPAPSAVLIAAAQDSLPEPIDHFLVQGDSTVVAPGPLQPKIARGLARFAQVESVGGAAVYRITLASVQKALAAGMSAAEMVDFLTQHSLTPVPQPVSYLITDTAARSQRLTLGAASAYLTGASAHELDLALAAIKDEAVAWERVSETVAVSSAPVAVVRKALDAAGIAAGISGGDLVVSQDDFAPPVRQQPIAVALTAADMDRLALVLTTPLPDAIQQSLVTPEVPRQAPAMMQAHLVRSVNQNSLVWLRYADNVGSCSVRLVEPITMSAGMFRGRDIAAGRNRDFAVSRIMGALPATNTNSSTGEA